MGGAESRSGRLHRRFFPDSPLRSHPVAKIVAVATLFLASRGVMLAFSDRVSWDVYYYWFGLHQDRPAGELLTEYPTPVAWALAGLHAVASELAAFKIWFALIMVGLDALTTVLLWRRSAWMGALWLAFGTAIGPITYFRIDLPTATLVALALLWSSARPRTAGALLGLAAAVKLWPALLAPLLVVGADSQRKPRLVGFLCMGGGLGLASLIIAGWERSLSPLAWQSERGLQIESIAATPLMLGYAFDPGTWHVGYSRFNAAELTGPGAGLALALTSLATVVPALLAAVLSWRLLKKASPEALAACFIAVVAWTIVFNKTFSPQYLWWLAGPVAIWCAWASSRRLATAVGLGTIVLALATGLIFPWCYESVISGSAAGVLLLALRNLGVVVLAFWALAHAWRTTGNFQVASGKQA